MAKAIFLERKGSTDKALKAAGYQPEFYCGSDSDGAEQSPSHHQPVGQKLSGREFDPVTFSFLKVEPEDFASQLTLLDLPIFQAIQPEELTSCAWSNAKEKLKVAPNVVGMSRRFNHVCLWCQKEILGYQKPKLRAEALAHFIKIAKRLLDLNNLHSAFAVVSGLQSSAIYRLAKTWNAVPSKERSSFEKMSRLFSEEKNWERLRKCVESAKLPCIPYLGLYTTDILHIDVAHPSSGGLDSTQRTTLMNNILRVLADFQQSKYEDLHLIDCIQSYLNSVRYIDELQKFVEEDLYRRSLQLEPNEPPTTGGTEGGGGSPTDTSALLSLSLARRDSLPVAPLYKTFLVNSSASVPTKVSSLSEKTQSLTPRVPPPAPPPALFRPGHRKTHSLGSGGPLKFSNLSFQCNETVPSLVPGVGDRHLLDDSLLDFSSCTASSSLSSRLPLHGEPGRAPLTPSRSVGSPTSRRKLSECGEDSGHETSDAVDGDVFLSERTCLDPSTPSSRRSSTLAGRDELHVACEHEGAVRRKTVLKDGRRPAVSPWNRYWLRLWGTTLLYFPARALPVRHWEQKSAYKSRLGKMHSISGWMVFMGDDPFNPDCFQLQEPSTGKVYKFRAGTHAKALEWVKFLKPATEKYKEKLPTNLMSFE